MQKLTGFDRIVVGLIFCHYLVYEVIFFFSYDFLGGYLTPLVAGWKLLFPVFLILYAGFPSGNLVRSIPWLPGYCFFFLAFLAWAAVPSMLSELGLVSLLEWFKLIPRAFFFLGVLAFFLRKPAAQDATLLLILGWGLFSVVQYLLLVFSGSFTERFVIPGVLADFGGPFGLLGNTTSISSFPGLPFPIVRLCGFWNEPSNASGSLFAGFFLARGFLATRKSGLWRYASWAFFIAGFLCLSNAGYIAISIALLFGAFMSDDRRWTAWFLRGAALLFAGSLVFAGFFGRTYVAENMPDNDLARVFVGLRGNVDVIKSGDFDATGGRLSLTGVAFEAVARRPQGLGLQSGIGTGDMSASAPVLWLASTGFVGLFLLFLREGAIVASVFSNARRSPIVMAACQAWIVVVVQHSVYGSWMNPIYFILTAAVFVATHRDREMRGAATQLRPRPAPKAIHATA